MPGDPDETQRDLQAVHSASRDVFVSYSSQDAVVANALVEALEQGGVSCWIAPRDVKAGAQYADAIVRALTGAEAFVLVLSEHAMASPHVSREIERASSKRRRIFAVRVDAAPLTPAFEYFLSESQWVEAQSGAMPAAYARLIGALREPAGTATQGIPAAIAGTATAGASAPPLRAHRLRILLAAGLTAVTVALVALYASRNWLAEHASARLPVAVATKIVNDKSVAVLPFENHSGKQDDASFADGMHDDILTQLTKIGSMTVIARTSVERFRNTRLTTREIGAMLGVARVLEGGVQRAGDRVHVAAQLIDAATDAHLWAESYDRKLTVANIFSIQNEIAVAIAKALKATLTHADRARLAAIPAQNLDAWEAYQLGRQRAANRTSTGLAESEKFFRRAIAFDPKFALAYAGLADTLVGQVDYSGAPRAATFAKAQQAIDTALRLDPDLGEAWASSATVAEFKDQTDRAEMMFRRAIALNPNYASAYQHYSAMLTFDGRADEALNLAKRAVELDPLSAIANSGLGWCLTALGRFDEAEVRFRKAIEIDPTMPRSYWDLGGFSAYARNRFADAVLFMEKATEVDPGHSYSLAVAEVYMDLDEAQAAQMIQAAQRSPRATGPRCPLPCTCIEATGRRHCGTRVACWRIMTPVMPMRCACCATPTR